MELIQLRYFLRVAETLNYSRAAESLYISRQSLRQTLGNLEKELGRPLFANDRNHLSLTEYGEYLRQSFQEPVQTFLDREAQVKEFFQQPIILQVAFAVSLFPSLLPNIDPVLQEFTLCYPHICLKINHYTTDEVIDRIESGSTDCGIVLQMPTPRANCVITTLRISDVAIASGPKSPLFGRDKVTLEDLSTIPLIGMGSIEKMAKPLWEDIQQKGIHFNYQVLPNTIDALYQIKNSMASGFNTFFNNPNRLPNSTPPKSLLPGYTWEVAALCPKSRPNHAAAQLLADFLRKKYFHPDALLPS